MDEEDPNQSPGMDGMEEGMDMEMGDSPGDDNMDGMDAEDGMEAEEGMESMDGGEAGHDDAMDDEGAS